MVCRESEVSVLRQERTAVAKSGSSAAPRTFLEWPTSIFFKINHPSQVWLCSFSFHVCSCQVFAAMNVYVWDEHILKGWQLRNWGGKPSENTLTSKEHSRPCSILIEIFIVESPTDPESENRASISLHGLAVLHLRRISAEVAEPKPKQIHFSQPISVGGGRSS